MLICLKTLRLIHRLSKKLNNDFNSKNLELLKKNTKILFRISGGRAKNKEYGLGHVYHAMNLSSRLKPAEFFFLWKTMEKQLLCYEDIILKTYFH